MTVKRTLGLAALMVSLAASAAYAELIVLQSTAPALKPGAQLVDGASVKIPSGKTVVFLLPSGATKTVSGPFEKPVSALIKGQSRNAALLTLVSNYIKTGGTSSDRTAATRGLTVGATAASGFSLTAVPVTARGPYCVVKGKPLKLSRSKGGQKLTVTIVDMTAAKRGQATFGAKATTADWPSDVTAGDARYAIVAKGQPMRQVTLKLIDAPPSDDEILPALFANKCEAQLKGYLDALK